MKNEEKYKTAEDRVEAFHEWCGDRRCDSCVFSQMCRDCDERTVGIDVMAHWLALEAEEEKPENCPFCGGETHGNLGHLKAGVVHYWVDCVSPDCMYRSAHRTDRDEAIAAHNRVARAAGGERDMSVEMNSRISVTACAMTLLLDEFGNELIEKIEKGTVAAYDDIMAFARDKTVAYFDKRSKEENENG